MKPMLSGKCDDVTKIRFPVLASPKLDGIRALVLNGVVLSRSLKPIPNDHVQQLFGDLEGYDGELIVGMSNSPTAFRDTTSGVMTKEGKPNVTFSVFDNFLASGTFSQRFATIKERPGVIRLPHHYCIIPGQILELEQDYLLTGFEGLMLRDPNGPYKQGRSTEREGYLLKLKRFEDSEALVLGMEEKMHNDNPAKVNALGHTERSSHMENMVPMNILGALIVRDVKTGVEFNIGTGFDDADRFKIWHDGLQQAHVKKTKTDGGAVVLFNCPMQLVKYKYFPTGSKDKPRFPTYLGIRSDL